MTAAPRRTGVVAFTIGSGVSQLSALLRYTLLARLLGPEQLGLAAIMVLTAQFFEQVTDAGLDRFLVQSQAGNTRSVNSAVHAVMIVRGLAIGSCIALSAGLLSRFFHYPELRQGLLLLAIAPALSGFSHFDFRRVQRHHRFGPEGVITAVSELVSLAAIVAAALLTRSFVAVAIALIARSAAAVAVSHLMARRPYRIGYARQHAPAMLAFGLPLMMNGVLLFVTGQGDRLFIGNQLGAVELGHYSAVILLILYPATMLSRLLQSITLPMIAAARGDPGARTAMIDRIAGQAVLLAMLMAAGFAVVAPVAVPLIYGPEFALPGLLIALIGILQAARFVRLWPVTVALATGHSRTVLRNSVVRLVAFPLAFLFVDRIGGLWGVVVAFTVAEFIAFAASMILLHRHGLGIARRDWRRIGLLALWLAAVAAVCAGAQGWGAALLWAGVALAVGSAVAAVSAERDELNRLAKLARGLARRRLRI